MKAMKKMMAFVLAIGMMLVMTSTAFAATITIDPKTPTQHGDDTTAPTYTYYVMMKASVGTPASQGAEAPVSYYVETADLATALDGLKVGNDDLFTVTRVGTTNHWNVTVNKKSDQSAFTGEEIAKALQTIKSNAIATGTASNNQITIDGDGYVLVESSLGTALVVDTLVTDTINEKNTYPTSNKTEDKTTAEIGEEVTYTVTVAIPETVDAKPITITDTISSGLTLNTAVTVTGAVADPAYTSATFQAGTATGQYVLTIPAATVLANKGKTLTFTYKATVNPNAVVDVDESNKAHIKYDNFTTVDVEVKVKTLGFDLEKVDKDNPEVKLAGVTFSLTNTAGEYYTTDGNDRFVSSTSVLTVATDAQGKISFAGLKAGSYTLTEVENPNKGYNMLTAPVTVTVAADGSVTVGDGATVSSKLVTITNAKGTELPSTGGMGTTILYIMGGALVVVCGIMLVAKKRTSNK